MEANLKRSDHFVQLDALSNALANIERLHNENIDLRRKLHEQFDMILKLQERVMATEKVTK